MVFADLLLARRVEEAQTQGRVEVTQGHVRLHPNAGVAVVELAGGFAIYDPFGSPSACAHAFGLGMKGPVTEAEVERLDHFYRERGVPAHVELCPLADPSLADLLGRHGYRLKAWTNVLARPSRPDEPAAELPVGIEVRPVLVAAAESWARLIAQGYTGQREVSAEMVGISRPLFDLPNARCFWGLVDGQPAGGGAVAWHQGVATLFGAGTLPRFRQRGLQTALLQARLACAAAAGCDLATTNTDPGSDSQRNAQRQGFQVIYTRALLVWAPATR